LLLAGDNKTKTLLASAYQDAFEVKADQVNTLNLELKYIMSEPLKDLSFVGYTPNSGDNASYLPIEGTYYEVVDITITTPGTGYARNERLLLNTGGDLDPVVKVTTVGGSGEIETVSIENPGRLAGASDFTSKTGITGTYVTGASGGTGAEFTITTQNGDVNYIPKDVPWLSYIGGRTSSGTGNNPLVFNVKIKNVANLLVAGGPNGKGDSYFTLENADLRIAAIGKGKAFSPVRKTFSSPSVASDPAENGSNTYLGSMTVNYTLDAATDFPGADEKGYGTLYYRATYRAFGLEVGSGWSIRSGRDLIELDEGSLSTGAAILIRIGNPGKYTSKVDVNIPTG
jgi:hypothetical protein